MATAHELSNKRKTERSANGRAKQQRFYDVRDNASGTDDEAISAIAAASPAAVTVDGISLVRDTISASETEREDIYKGSVTYKDPDRESDENKDPQPTGSDEFNFDIRREAITYRWAIPVDVLEPVRPGAGTGGSFGFEQYFYANIPLVLPDDLLGRPDGVIGWTRERGVQGSNYGGVGAGFSFTRYIPNADVTPLYLLQLQDSIATRNSDTFQGFPPGDLLLESARGQKRNTADADDWAVTFDFLLGEEIDGEDVAGVAGVSAPPHSIIEAYYVESFDDAKKLLTQTVKYVTVSQPFKLSAFGLLIP